MDHRATSSLFECTSVEEQTLPTSRPRKVSSPFDDHRVPAQTTFWSLVEAGIEPKPSFSVYDAHKSRLCPKYHDEGLCELGLDCPLVHEEKTHYVSSLDPNAPEFFPRSTRKCLTTSGSFKPSGSFSEVHILGRDLTFPLIRHSYSDFGERRRTFKTRPCKFFQATGRCRYGTKCFFAHNEKEKRVDISKVYKYKTEICQRWLRRIPHSAALCHYAHGASELQPNFDLPPFLP
ncbi:unnamed protein product [Clavelina lepadiformis]|uniref:C3H1-type domain-containing protein n=1 Tax=Clavelina lepadiformis TaxID=159417 RepID=A0ABP0FK72_CLALP